MNSVFQISPTLAVTIKEKNERIYVQLCDGTTRFFISSKTWNDKHWMSSIDNATDSVSIGYQKYGRKQTGGFIQLENRGMSKSKFLITSSDWLILHDVYDAINDELVLLMNNCIRVYNIADEYGETYLREVDLWNAHRDLWTRYGSDFHITMSTVQYPGDAKIAMTIVEYMSKNVLCNTIYHPACISAAFTAVLSALNRPNTTQYVDYLVNKIYVRRDVSDIDNALIPNEYIRLYEKLSLCG